MLISLGSAFGWSIDEATYNITITANIERIQLKNSSISIPPIQLPIASNTWQLTERSKASTLFAKFLRRRILSPFTRLGREDLHIKALVTWAIRKTVG
jgi:hypothetical protein